MARTITREEMDALFKRVGEQTVTGIPLEQGKGDQELLKAYDTFLQQQGLLKSQ